MEKHRGQQAYRIEVDEEWMLPLLWGLHCAGLTDFEMVELNVIRTTSTVVVDAAKETFAQIPQRLKITVDEQEVDDAVPK